MSKGHLGSRGGVKASKIKLKDLNFLFSLTNVSILSIFCAHARKEYRKIEKMKGTYIHNIFVLLLLETCNGFTKRLV